MHQMDVSKAAPRLATEGPKCTTEDSAGWASPADHSRVQFDTKCKIRATAGWAAQLGHSRVSFNTI